MVIGIAAVGARAAAGVGMLVVGSTALHRRRTASKSRGPVELGSSDESAILTAPKRRVDLAEDDLRGADLRKADLRGADLESRDLTSADLTGARLDRATLCGAQLDRCDLSWASLRDADLRGATLQGANLVEADLCRAHLEGADLTGVSNIAAALWRGAVANKLTRWPPGFSPTDAGVVMARR